MNSKEIKNQHFLVAFLRVVQYWNKCVILSFFQFNGTFSFIYEKSEQKQSKMNFLNEFQIEMGCLLLFQKNRNETKAKGIDIINIGN